MMLTLTALLVLAGPVDRYALIIGYNGSTGTNLQPLHFADDDALAMGRLFADAGAHTTVLTQLDAETAQVQPAARVDGPPTLAAVATARERIFTAMRDGATREQASELIIFFSGHGEVDNGEGQLLLEDGRLSRRMLFEEILGPSPASVNHVIIDACKSSYLTYEKGIGGSRRVFTGSWQDADHFETLSRTGFLLSTSSGRDSHEWERFQAGVFSHEVRSALRGAADVDADGAIDYAEIGGFLTSANRAIPNARYRPDFLVRPPGVPPGDLLRPLLSWPSPANVWLDGNDLQHVYIESPTGERFVDAHAGPRQTVPLHLPAERPVYVRDAGETRERVIASDAVTRIETLDNRATVLARKGALAVALDQLFASPFDRLDVDRFAASYDMGTLGQVDEAPGIVRHRVQVASAVGAGIGAGVGAGLLIWAHVLAGRNDTPQADRSHVNHEIHGLNTSAIIALAVAGAAAVIWGTATATAPAEEQVSEAP